MVKIKGGKSKCLLASFLPWEFSRAMTKNKELKYVE